MVLALRRWARQSPLALDVYLRWKSRRQLAVQPGRTQICIEAYPRSANSSTFRKFIIANPGAVVAHHTHTVANVAAAVRHGVPTLILIRRPPDPILSALVAMRHPRPDDALGRYVDFYGWVEDHLEGLLLADFDTVLSDWNGVIEAVNRRFGTRFATHEDSEEASRRTEAFIRARMDAEGGSRHVTNIPLPSSQRDELKQSFRSLIESHPLYAEVERVYARLRPHCISTAA